MNVIRSFGPIDTKKPHAVIAIGFFDGVHLGHQRVIRLCREQAAAENAEAWVMTFDPHPLHLLQPANAPRLLTTLACKLDLLATLQVDGVMVVPFTPDFSRLTPGEFLANLTRHIPGLRSIVVGQNWRFGRNASGDTALLREQAASLPFNITIADPAETSGRIISSSRIRACLAAGQLDEAAAMLGRNLMMRGIVIDGLKRGRRLGFPTANIDITGRAIPPPGIYAGRVHRKDQPSFDGAVYLPASTTPEAGPLEVHLIDFEGDLYGEELTVEFIQKIRDDNLRFDNESGLIRQIAHDVATIRQILPPHV